MKLLSFLISIALHVVALAVFLYIIKTPVIHSQNKVYNVDLVTLIKPKPELKKSTPKIKTKPVKKKNQEKKVKQKKKPLKKKPLKRRTVKKTKHKIVKKVKKKNLNRVYSKLLEQKIEQLKKKIEQEEQEKLREKLIEQKIAMLRERLQKKIEEGKKKEEVANSYIQLIKGIIDSNWGVEKSLIKNKNYITKVDIKLDFRGDLVYKKIVKSSGNAYFDGTIMEAIQKSAPFPKPPPEILDNGFVEFIITFKSEEKQ